MSACTFFGHRDCYGLNEEILRDSIEKLINLGVAKIEPLEYS